VHGSFFTGMVWRIKDSDDSVYQLQTESNHAGFLLSRDSPASADRDALSVVCNYTGKTWKEWNGENVRILAKQLSIIVTSNGWRMCVTRRPIYNWVSGPFHFRYDIEISPLVAPEDIRLYGAPSPTCHPHGLIGQGWDGRPRQDGKQDDYTFDPDHPVVVTSAMAEGAIDGVAQEYALDSPSSTRFAYSRFHRDAKDSCASLHSAKFPLYALSIGTAT